MSYVFTPQSFFDIFVLCFSWEPDPHQDDPRWSWTTVDKVAAVLSRLKILSDKQKKAASRDRRTQSIFVMKSKFCGAGQCDRQVLRNDPKMLAFICEVGDDLNRERMLRNMRVFITAAGRAYAAKLEQRYSNVVTKEAYLAELAVRDAEFTSGAAHAAASDNYRRRLYQELSEENR